MEYRILKLLNQLLSHRGNKIQSNDPKKLEDISRRFLTGLSYMCFSLSEVSQWCKTVDYLGKKEEDQFSNLAMLPRGHPFLFL
jgi:hypothetical protein